MYIYSVHVRLRCAMQCVGEVSYIRAMLCCAVCVCVPCKLLYVTFELVSEFNGHANYCASPATTTRLNYMYRNTM